MKEKLCAISLATLLLLPCFTACGGGTASNENNATADTTAATTVAETEVYYLDELSDKTFDGMTFTMEAESYEQRPNFSSGELTGAVLNDALYERELALEARYNIKVETNAETSRSKCHTAVANAVTAGDDTYDLVFGPLLDCVGLLLTENYITCLSDLPYLDFSEPWWAQTMMKNFTVNGKVYTGTGGCSPSYYLSAQMGMFNKELASDYKLPDLYNLVLTGKWTLDKLGEICELCYKDLNGDGLYDSTNDLIPIVQNSACGLGYFASAGGVLVERDEKGNYYLDLTSEKNINIMDKCRSVFGKENASVVIDELTGKIAPFIKEHTVFAFTTMMFAAQEVRDMESAYGILPYPKLDEKQENYITNGNTYAPCFGCIPRSATNAETSALILEAMAFMGEEKLRSVIYDVTLNGKIAQDKETSQMLEIIYSDIYFDFNGAFDFAKSCDRVRKYIVGKEDNFVSSYAAIKESAEKALADTVLAMQSVD